MSAESDEREPGSEPEDEQEGRSERKSKKERVLHTRVPAVLEQELKNLAASWRMPVSNVVRAILEDALDTVEAVGRKAEGELMGVAHRLAEERERLRSPLRARPAPPEPTSSSAQADVQVWNRSAIEGAIGFTAMVLANETTCPVTGKIMRAGEAAYLVMFAEPGRHAIVSPKVVPRPA
ncbi:MAG: hypothetical protein H5U40_12175 [Polyangiaceae bacterium]|nr:hypothetical protein [Polyangiaceae bacterium]